MSIHRHRPIDTSAVMPSPLLKWIYRYVQPAIEKAIGFPALWDLYDAGAGKSTTGFATAILDRLNIPWEIADEDLQKLRAIEGPVVVHCNHPFGGIDAMALILTLDAMRPGQWKMLANHAVASIPELKAHMIAVDPLASGGAQRASSKGLITSLRHLKKGGVLGLFAAGRVSIQEKNTHAIRDLPWTDHGLRLAETTKATIVTLHISGANSARFLKIPPKWSHLRALMLCREMTRPSVDTIKIRIAEIILPGTKTTPEKLHAHCFLREDLDVKRPVAELVKVPSRRGSISLPESSAAFDSLTKTHNLFETTGLDVLLFKGSEVPDAVMIEIGRCREITFRAAGQGVGSDIDLTAEDPYYYHLVLWDRQARRLMGAYRMGKIHEILDSRGPSALYLDHIFEIEPEFYDKLGQSFELSRSFILPEFQKDSRALAALWKGLGLAAVKHKARSYFGSVTISNAHHPVSRAILVEYLRQNHADTEKLRAFIKARNPFAPLTKHHKIVADSYKGEPISALSPLIERIENGERGIPPLMRYYCSLGAKFLAYHVEPSFQDALYSLLRVDLDAMSPRYRKRFMGI